MSSCAILYFPLKARRMSTTKESREAFRQRMRPDHSKDACYQARQNSHKCLEENNYDQGLIAGDVVEVTR